MCSIVWGKLGNNRVNSVLKQSKYQLTRELVRVARVIARVAARVITRVADFTLHFTDTCSDHEHTHTPHYCLSIDLHVFRS